VVERRQLYSDEQLVLWRFDGKRVLHKFAPETQSDGNIVHKPSVVVRLISFTSLYGAGGVQWLMHWLDK